jgi:hypothetical protein
MNDVEFQKLLNAQPPLVLKASIIESLFIFFKIYSLTLNRQNFIIRMPWGKRIYQWSEVSGFHVADAPWTTYVAPVSPRVFFDNIASRKSTFIERLFFVKHSYLPANYGLTASQLAELMNHWRENALQQNG